MNCRSTTQTKTSSSFSPIQTGLLQRKCTSCGQHTIAGGECTDCGKKKRLPLQRRATNQSELDEIPPTVHEVLKSPGQPLDSETREFMESRFRYDFSGVRIHTDPKAAESTQAVDALAYTVGRNVVFGTGQYSPKSSTGQKLIAHELTHVLQQSSGAASSTEILGSKGVSDSNNALERQADEVAAHIDIDSKPFRLLPVSAKNTIQRKESARSRPTTVASRRAPIVEDGQRVAPGQMHRSTFLTTLQNRLIQETDAVLATVGHTARGCPYILRTIERYGSRPISSLLRFIQHFAHPPAGADAGVLINAVTQRARRAALKIATTTGGQRLQAMTESDSRSLVPHNPVAIRSQLGSGRMFDGSTRKQMEQSFGANFGSVRIHDDATANRLNNDLRARAFTIGNDIAFATGQYRPGTLSGDALLAHELAHTLQQSSIAPETSNRTTDQVLEHQADQAAIAAISGREGIGSSLQDTGQGLRIQRTGIEEGALIVALVAALQGAEVTVVAGEVILAGAEVTETALVFSEAAPLIAEAAPLIAEAAPLITEAAPLITEAASSSSALSTAAAATVGVGVAATTLSGDSPQPQQEDRNEKQQDCFQRNLGAGFCHEPVFDGDDIRDETVAMFLMDNGYDFGDLGQCRQFGSPAGPGVINDCGGAPAISYHCNVKRSTNVVSIFACLCCDMEGNSRFQWSRPHWSDPWGRRVK